MSATNSFFIWFFTGLKGLGGWLIFLILALAGVIWLFYDSSNRRIRASGWKLAATLLALLVLPAMLYRFSSAETQLSLDPFVETIFYLGLLGGILPPVLAIGYYVTYKGLTGCQNGHVYDKALGQCPECTPVPPPVDPNWVPHIIPGPPRPPDLPPIHPQKPHANAWLVTRDGKNYQLCIGETTIGRRSTNDIMLDEESVSREHAKIVEQNGRFRLYHVSTTTYTKINGNIVRQPTLLEPDDEVQFGEKVSLRFITAHR